MNYDQMKNISMKIKTLSFTYFSVSSAHAESDCSTNSVSLAEVHSALLLLHVGDCLQQKNLTKTYKNKTFFLWEGLGVAGAAVDL